MKTTAPLTNAAKTALKTFLALSFLLPTALAPTRATPLAPRSHALASADLSLADLLDQVRPSVVKIETESGLGTGFVVRKDGLILTAAHVVEGARSAKVRFHDGRTARVTRVLKTDRESDYALLKIEGSNYSALRLADSEQLRQGEKAFTLGTPLGLDFTASEGIVSALRNAEGRSVARGGGVTYIQLTAPISPGNSGGPVFNAQGEVLGIAVFKRTDGENLNFALAINQAKDALRNPGEGVALSEQDPSAPERPSRPGGRFSPSPSSPSPAPQVPSLRPSAPSEPGGTQTAAWFVVATENTNSTKQALDTITNPDPLADRESIAQRWRSGFQVVDIAEAGKGWLVTFNRTSALDNTNIVTKSTFPGTEVQAALDRGEAISSMVYGHGRWVVVFSRYASNQQQVVKLSASYPREWVQSRAAQGYRVTAVQAAGGEWATVMARGTGLTDQRVLHTTRFPQEWLEAKWAEGYRVTSLGSAEGGFVVVVSRGSNLGRQAAVSSKGLPADWIRTCYEKGMLLTTMR